jgi:predicted Zn-dependent protease
MDFKYKKYKKVCGLLIFFFLFSAFLQAGWFKRLKKKIKAEWKKSYQKQSTSANSYGLWSALSKSATDQLSSRYGLYRDERVVQHVREIGRKVSLQSGKRYNYRFNVLNTDMVNAFAMPDGHIYVTKGLLKTIDSDDELAFVLGHETAHVVNRDAYHALTKNLLFNLALYGILGKKKVNKYKWLILVQNLLMLKYSRNDERDADAQGIRYAYQAGYDPDKAVAFFYKLKKLEGNVSGLQKNMLKILSDHPLTDERIRRVKQIAAQLKHRQ